MTLLKKGEIAFPSISLQKSTQKDKLKNLKARTVRFPERPASFSEVYRQITPSVIHIFTSHIIEGGAYSSFYGKDNYYEAYERFYQVPKSALQKGLGTGFIISPDGYILTNFHIIENAIDIKVKLHNGNIYAPKLIGKDKRLNIALLKIDPIEKLTPVKFGDFVKLAIGEWVLAFGNPFGLSTTISAGIVSAVGYREGIRPMDLFQLIQTDATIHAENSGGPLTNIFGEVVGINYALKEKRAGINFAIPINIIQLVLPKLKEQGKISWSWIGVKVVKLSKADILEAGLKEGLGVRVKKVISDGPADKVGLAEGDIIIKLGQQVVADINALSWLAANLTIEAEVPLTFIRKKEVIEVQISPIEMPVEE